MEAIESKNKAETLSLEKALLLLFLGFLQDVNILLQELRLEVLQVRMHLMGLKFEIEMADLLMQVVDIRLAEVQVLNRQIHFLGVKSRDGLELLRLVSLFLLEHFLTVFGLLQLNAQTLDHLVERAVLVGEFDQLEFPYIIVHVHPHPQKVLSELVEGVPDRLKLFYLALASRFLP